MSINLEKILACPRCKTALKSKSKIDQCPKCSFKYQKREGIWDFLLLQSKQTKLSQKTYDKMHKANFGGPNDGSYEILASIARGNKTIDIACGEGLIEKLSPETVGVEFSLNALKKAQKNGCKNLVLADAEHLPFQDDSFDIAISAGSLEHFPNPEQAIFEMARVSKIQILTVHRHPPIPFAHLVHNLTTKVLNVQHQPIEKPLNMKELEKMFKNANLKIIFKGVWTIPLNYGRVIKFLPEFKSIPSCSFIISIKL